MKDGKTENFLKAGGYKFSYHAKVNFSDIDMIASKENPARWMRRVNDDVVEQYALAMQDGADFPAIVVIATDPKDAKFLYIIATGVHRSEAALMFPKDGIDAYVVVEPDQYRRESLIRRLNTIEGAGITIRDQILQCCQMHEEYPDKSLKTLAEEWHLKATAVKNAWNERQALARGRRFGFDFEAKGPKLTRTSLAAMNSITNDVVYKRLCEFAVGFEPMTSEVEQICKEIKACRDETSMIAVIERATKEAMDKKLRSQAKHGRVSSSAATRFFGDLQRINRQADKGLNLLYLSAYPRRDLARALLHETRHLLSRIEAELDRIDRSETLGSMPPPPPPPRSGSPEAYA